MKTLMKTSAVAVLAVAIATLGTSNARAWGGGGWPIAAGVFGGLAVGTAIGATVASANAPTYVYPTYSYPVYPPAYSAYATYPAPAYDTAAPTVQTAQPVQHVQPTPIQPVVQPVATPVYVQQPVPVYYYPRTVVYGAPYPYVYPYYYGRAGWGYYPRHFGYRRW